MKHGKRFELGKSGEFAGDAGHFGISAELDDWAGEAVGSEQRGYAVEQNHIPVPAGGGLVGDWAISGRCSY